MIVGEYSRIATVYECSIRARFGDCSKTATVGECFRATTDVPVLEPGRLVSVLGL